jgi:MarR family transcriptional regulator, lower aerobic nicotinate degradation pathway regulator
VLKWRSLFVKFVCMLRWGLSCGEFRNLAGGSASEYLGMGEFGTTPVQSSIMQVLLMQPGIDQVALAGEIGVDRTTTSSVLARLHARGIVSREIDPENRRTKRAFLTDQGRAMLFRMQQSIDEAHEELVGPLDRAERQRFLAQLVHLVQANNDRGRTFLRYI